MITLDDREDTTFFLQYLPRNLVTVARLEYGDASFVGNGPQGEPILVGIERKTVGDLINSIVSGRLAGHQLLGLLNSYAVVYLVVEGLYRPGRTGLLEIRQGRDWVPLDRGRRWMWQDVEGWLTTVETRTGVRLRKTPRPEETAAVILALYRWWTGKSYHEHRAHLTLHRPHNVAELRRSSLVRVMAAELPGIGWEKSARVAERYASVVDMVAADRRSWEAIEGVGKILSKKIVEALGNSGAKKVKERKP